MREIWKRGDDTRSIPPEMRALFQYTERLEIDKDGTHTLQLKAGLRGEKEGVHKYTGRTWQLISARVKIDPIQICKCPACRAIKITTEGKQ